MGDPLLLPLDAAIPRRRTMPPPRKIPMSREERVDLLRRRDSSGFLLWNPADKLDHDVMSKTGFAGDNRNDNGTDKPPTFTSLEAMADAIAQRRAQRKGAA